jgi:hypothetical protein
MTNKIPFDGSDIEKCYVCIHKKTLPNNTLISCDDYDNQLVGYEIGIENGWFDYPHAFDPVWIANDCRHFSPEDDPRKG